ncbi:MAG: hypothetical protein ABIH23_08325 [bacterium]
MGTQWHSWKEQSKRDWGQQVLDEEALPDEQIKIGAILRIADALEKMSEPYLQLLRRLEIKQKSGETQYEEIKYLDRRIAALKGVITKLKKKGR